VSIVQAIKYTDPSSCKGTLPSDSNHWLLVFALIVFLFGNTFFKTTLYTIALVFFLAFSVFNLRSAFRLAISAVGLFPLVLIFLASYLWSFVPHLTLDAIRSQIVFVLFALLISSKYRFDGFSSSLLRAVFFIVGIVSFYCLVFWNAAYSSAGLAAFYNHKNTLGGTMALCALVLFNAPYRKRFHLYAGMLAIAILAATLSKTSIALFVVCTALLKVVDVLSDCNTKKHSYVTLKEVAASSLVVIALLLLVALVVFRDEFISIVWDNLPKTALTGRGMLWLVVIQQIRSYSLLGIGPGVFWQGGGVSEIAQTTLYLKDPYWVQRMGSADGGYIDLVASIGMLGLAFFLLTAIDFYRRLRIHWQRPDSRLLFVLVTFVLLHAITESTILHSTNIFWLIYLLCYFRVCGYSVFLSEPPRKEVII